jgi:hypothetical protein
VTESPDFTTKPTLKGELAVCNFRILIAPRGRDRGLGSEATRLIVGYGFERLHLHRISLEVYAFNPRARCAVTARDREYPIAPKCCYSCQ